MGFEEKLSIKRHLKTRRHINLSIWLFKLNVYSLPRLLAILIKKSKDGLYEPLSNRVVLMFVFRKFSNRLNSFCKWAMNAGYQKKIAAIAPIVPSITVINVPHDTSSFRYFLSFTIISQTMFSIKGFACSGLLCFAGCPFLYLLCIL